MATKFKTKRILQLQVEACECREAPRLVAATDVVPVCVPLRIRKASVGIENRNELELVRKLKDAPEEDAVRSVAGERSVLIGSDQGVRKIPEELIVVVEFAPRAGTYVTGHEVAVLGRVPPNHGQEFIVRLAPGVEELELRWLIDGGQTRVDEEFAAPIAMFITDTEQEIFVQLVVELERGAAAVR